MSNQRLKIENLENLQELNAEEFSSIQGGLDEIILLESGLTLDLTSLDSLLLDPGYSTPCESYIFDEHGEIILELTCLEESTITYFGPVI